jgi:hypothetical protein
MFLALNFARSGGDAFPEKSADPGGLGTWQNGQLGLSLQVDKAVIKQLFLINLNSFGVLLVMSCLAVVVLFGSSSLNLRSALPDKVRAFKP